MHNDEIQLEGGNVNTVVRVGDTVRRGLTPNSATVHRLLLHLQDRGFDGCPRFLGIDEQNREILSFIDGETGILPSIWQSDEALIATAQMLRRYHDATVDFAPAGDAMWAYRHPDPERSEVICHNDFAPYNFVYEDGVPVAVLDFDLAGPGPRIKDVAYAAYWTVPLSFNSADQVDFATADVAQGSRRLHLFCDTYGIAADDDLLDMIADVLARMGDERTMQEMVGRDVAARLKRDGHLAHWQREAAAFQRHRAWIEANLARDDSARHGPESRRAVTMQSTPVYTHPPSKGHNMPSPQKELVRNLPRGVSQPARRALASAGYTDIEELAQATEAELLKLHGMGPKAIGLIRDELEARGLSFKE